MDLLVASGPTSGLGEIRFYKNNGTQQKPVFSSYSLVSAGSEPIKFTRIQLQVADVTNDGKKDLIIGEGNTPICHIYLFENIGTITNPQFKKGVRLKLKDGTEISDKAYFLIGIYDWDSNGTMDIIWSGYLNGGVKSYYLYVYKNDSPTPIKPKKAFSEQFRIQKFTRVDHGFTLYGIDQKFEPKMIELFTTKGRKIISSQLIKTTNQSWFFQSSALPTGIFYVHLLNSTGNSILHPNQNLIIK